MGAEIVHDDDVAFLERRAENPLNIGSEDLRVGRTSDGHTRRRAIQADGRDHGGGPPVTARRGGMNPFATLCAPTQAGHVGLGTAFVDEDEPRQGLVEERLAPFDPMLARPPDLGTPMLAGPEGLFYD